MKRDQLKLEWEELAVKIKEAKESVSKSISKSNSEISLILSERAKSVATVDQATYENEERISIIEFQLGKERYAFETLHVNEVCNTNKICTLPSTPDYIYGVINLRGKIVAVIDLKKYLQLNYIGIDDFPTIIIVNYNGVLVGIVADEIIGVKDVLRKNIQLEKPKLLKIKENFLIGINDETVLILDVIKLLDDSQIQINNRLL
jgi:purine-binding chemotaxis protein CheW